MYLIEAIKEAEPAREKAAQDPPFGPGFDKDVVDKTARIEVWGSSLDEGYSDFCVFKVFDDVGELITERQIGGY